MATVAFGDVFALVARCNDLDWLQSLYGFTLPGGLCYQAPPGTATAAIPARTESHPLISLGLFPFFPSTNKFVMQFWSRLRAIQNRTERHSRISERRQKKKAPSFISFRLEQESIFGVYHHPWYAIFSPIPIICAPPRSTSFWAHRLQCKIFHGFHWARNTKRLQTERVRKTCFRMHWFTFLSFVASYIAAESSLSAIVRSIKKPIKLSYRKKWKTRANG